LAAFDIVAPDVGGLREIIACDLDGFLLTDHVPELFAGKCVELYKDHQLRKKIGNAARLKIIDQFSVNHMAEGYYRLYNKILTSSY
jgi:glycosyltransferase involved in cell wall biosynthesis